MIPVRRGEEANLTIDVTRNLDQCAFMLSKIPVRFFLPTRPKVSELPAVSQSEDDETSTVMNAESKTVEGQPSLAAAPPSPTDKLSDPEQWVEEYGDYLF